MDQHFRLSLDRCVSWRRVIYVVRRGYFTDMIIYRILIGDSLSHHLEESNPPLKISDVGEWRHIGALKSRNRFQHISSGNNIFFDTLIKPILLYGSDFWGCLPLAKNSPIEKLHFMFCKHLVGVYKTTTTEGVLLEPGRLPYATFKTRVGLENYIITY